MAEIYFSNFQLEEGTEYFLFIGELKNYGLNIFLKEALARIFNRKFDFIAVVPDVFEQYNYENLIVINPRTNAYTSQYGSNVSCRVSAQEFLTCVSESRQIKILIKRLLNRQSNLFIYMYESLPELTLDEIPGVSILGPDKHIAFRINSKAYQYQNLSLFLPVVDHAVCRGFDELIRTTDKLWSQWKDGIFVSQEYSAAGTNSIIAHGATDIAARFQDQNETYIISRYIPHDHDPTVLAIVAGEDDVYIAGIADQHIEDGTRFTGSTFPSVLSAGEIAQLREYTVIAGRWLAREGYRGIFGCDFLVAADGKIFFLEINARKQGTTMEFTCTLEQSLPPGSPMLPELEFYAVTEGLFPANTVEMKSNPKNLHWGTYNFKIRTAVCTEGYIPQSANEREAFKKVADGRLKKDFLIMEHTGCDFIIAEGSFIARIVALGHYPADVLQGLNQGRKTIQLTIAEKKIT
ncbi:MAG: ATP-grasp domain-containing protein [Pseudomonadota bacterium]|uniref:ATP-grasp domain-containing protein n=1 Tax=Candidatus Desulfatibia profunda TaxID=2841695 RepID=A0A8J6TP56_9BACT|nr:ATP-grasp domain-containing protein [Candidatus Desulfatibia profunda]MBL7181415.1 ATP-grasp domain-containing protein [Desulfobacterales bacterium]